MSSTVLFILTVAFMVLIIGAFIAARQRQREDPVQAAALAYRQNVGGPFGLLPPRMEPVGLALTGLTVVAFVAALVLLLTNSTALLPACGVMVLSNMFAVRRDRAWLANNAEYQAILSAKS